MSNVPFGDVQLDQDALNRGMAEMELNRRGDPGGVPLTPGQAEHLAESLGQSGPADIPGVTPVRTVDPSQVGGDPDDMGVVRRIGPPPAVAGQEQPQPQAPGTVTVGAPVRTRGRRPRSELWEPEMRTAQRYDIASRGMGQSAQDVGRLSTAQSFATGEGVRRVEEMQRDNEERRQEARQGIQRTYAQYLDRVRAVEEAAEPDPGRAWARRDTGSRIMASIAVGLQGLARMFGRPIENGAIQNLQALVRQDLDLQQEEYRRDVRGAELQHNIYSIMRQQFQDENVAMEMSEASAWRIIQARVEGYGNQIQNEQARNRLGMLATQAGAQADQAQLRGLRAQSQEMARSRGSVRVPLTTQTPNGPVTTYVTQRELGRRMLAVYQHQAERAGEPTEISATDQRRAVAAINLFSRSSGGQAVQNTIAAQRAFRDLVREGVAESGGDPRSVDIPGFNPFRAVAGDGRIRQYVMDQLMEGGRGAELRQASQAAIYNWIKEESGAHFTDAEFMRRNRIILGESQTPEQIMYGLEILGRASTGSLRIIRALGGPDLYQDMVVEGLDFGYDPIAATDFSANQMRRDIMGGAAPSSNAYSRSAIEALIPEGPLLDEWRQQGINQQNPDWLRRQEARRAREAGESPPTDEGDPSSFDYAGN